MNTCKHEKIALDDFISHETDETKKKLYKIKGQIESKKGKPSSMDQTINELIKEYQKRK